MTDDRPFFDIDNCRSYATETNLTSNLVRLGLLGFRHLVVCNRKGRYTAVFAVTDLEGNVTMPARHGFMVFG